MVVAHSARLPAVRPRTRVGRLWRRKSTIAFAMALPLLLIVGLLVLYPSLYAFYLAALNKSMERFVGVANFAFLFKRETFWMVVKQSIIFAVSAATSLTRNCRMAVPGSCVRPLSVFRSMFLNSISVIVTVVPGIGARL